MTAGHREESGPAAGRCCSSQCIFFWGGWGASPQIQTSTSMKKCLTLYGSQTGNTEKVAIKIKSIFEEKGWHSEIIKLSDDYDILTPGFDFSSYDFVCVGSPVIWRLPLEQVVMVMRSRPRGNHKIIPGPKRAMVFCTYAGIHLGGKEAEAALKLLEIEVEHLGFKVVGALAVPGRYGKSPTPAWFHGDMRNRPDDRDLQNVKAFVDGILE